MAAASMRALALDGPCTSATRRQAIAAEAARLFLAAHASGAETDWNAAYRWIAEDPAHGCAFAKIEAGWALLAGLRDVATEQCHEGVVTIAPPRPASGARVTRKLAIGAIAACLIGAGTTALCLELTSARYVQPCRNAHVGPEFFPHTGSAPRL